VVEAESEAIDKISVRSCTKTGNPDMKSSGAEEIKD
jgi:hypothetical protein